MQAPASGNLPAGNSERAGAHHTFLFLVYHRSAELQGGNAEPPSRGAWTGAMGKAQGRQRADRVCPESEGRRSGREANKARQGETPSRRTDERAAGAAIAPTPRSVPAGRRRPSPPGSAPPPPPPHGRRTSRRAARGRGRCRRWSGPAPWRCPGC